MHRFWQGLAIDMANNVAKALDVKLEVVVSSWANAAGENGVGVNCPL